MKILITGAKGQLGHKLAEKLEARSYKLIPTDSDSMDITNAEATMKTISDEKPDIILHCAAYTKVDQAEEEKELAERINAIGTRNIAKAAKKNNSILFYVSTDYVFDGLGDSPLKESDPTDPVNFYGETKLAGEKFIQKICDKFYIIRTSWLYGELPKNHPGTNFVETMLRLAKERDNLTVVDDQIGSPTYTGDLIDSILFILNSIESESDSSKNQVISSGTPSPETRVPFGIYHFSGEGETTWCQFAKEIFDQTGTKINLRPITTAEYPTKAKRPHYSYLSKEKIKSAGVFVRPWQDGLKEYLQKRQH